MPLGQRCGVAAAAGVSRVIRCALGGRRSHALLTLLFLWSCLRLCESVVAERRIGRFVRARPLRARRPVAGCVGGGGACALRALCSRLHACGCAQTCCCGLRRQCCTRSKRSGVEKHKHVEWLRLPQKRLRDLCLLSGGPWLLCSLCCVQFMFALQRAAQWGVQKQQMCCAAGITKGGFSCFWGGCTSLFELR